MATTLDVDTPQARRIAPPKAGKPPLKSNIFEFMQDCTTALGPMFPYLGPGDMVPAGAVFRGSPGADWGQFFHFNTVDEISICFGSSGGLMQTGQAMALARLHGVNSFLKDANNPESFLLVCVTQRQSEAGDQSEATIFRCQKCHEVLLRYEYDAKPPSESEDRFPPFSTLGGGVDAAEVFNGSDEQRTCKKCGTLNPPFPADRWGWRQWVVQNQTVNAARRDLLATAAQQLAEG